MMLFNVLAVAFFICLGIYFTIPSFIHSCFFTAKAWVYNLFRSEDRAGH